MVSQSLTREFIFNLRSFYELFALNPGLPGDKCLFRCRNIPQIKRNIFMGPWVFDVKEV